MKKELTCGQTNMHWEDSANQAQKGSTGADGLAEHKGVPGC